MGDSQNEDLRVGFDRRLKLKFCGNQVTTDAGLLAYRELDEALGLTEQGADVLTDSRQGRNKQHQLVPLLRQSIYSRLAGYDDVNDAERLCVDPALRHVVGGRASQPEKQAASSSEVGRFETKTLSTNRNLTALMKLSGRWTDNVHRRRPLKELILDMDSSVSETYGRQQGTAYNGHFECLCYHPLFLFNQFGDLERAMLRRGNKASAKYWRNVLLPVIEGYRHLSIPKFFRGDAAFALPKLMRLLEDEGYQYAIRIKSNAVLEREIEHLLTRPVGRPSHKPKVLYQSFQYQAKSWQRARRVVAKIEWHAGELFPRVGFIVTNLKKQSKNVVKFYNGRGTAEQWIKEGKNAIKWTKLSCRTFKDNQVRLQLFALAYNLGNFLRRLALPKPVQNWSLTTLREKLIKMGAKVTRHSKYVFFQLAEVAVTRNLFAAILDRIARLALPPPLVE
ncbi:IS1380 family transposase [uncultured Gimesia sp.]|uniref:IS1380 family transposase n=1 Tax=uncultured Gimesia sp. TaxID=1678688 RepID=UPI0026058BE1|nr:IS1380 family transposase [uncultured Gimesia sp.]